MENNLLIELTEYLSKNYGFNDPKDFIVIQDTDYNSVVSFTAQGKKMIARSGKIIKPEEVKEEVSALDYLSVKGIIVPKIIPALTGELVTSLDFSKTLTIFEFIDGRSFETSLSSRPKKEEAYKAAKVLAMIHRATKNNDRLKRIHHSVDSEIKKAIANKELIIDKYIDGDKFVDELTLALQKIENFDRNSGLVHGDYRSKNLIFDQQSDEVEAVIDFEWYFFGPTLYDLGLMLVEWSCPDRQDYFDKEILEAVLSGYSEEYGQKVELNEEIKFWMYYSALSDATTFLLRRAQNSSSSEKIKIGSFMYQKALMVKNYG